MRPHAHTDAEEHPAERQERLLAAAVGILTGDEGASTVSLRERLGAPEMRRIEEAIREIAEQYQAEHAASGGSGRIKDAVADLARIERACVELAAAFDEAGQDAYNALSGYGPGGITFRNIAWGGTHGRKHLETGLDFGTLVKVTSRYQIPIGPEPSSADALDEIHRIAIAQQDELAALRTQRMAHRQRDPLAWEDPSSDCRAALDARIDKLQGSVSSYGMTDADHGDAIHWPEAVAALGAMVGTYRSDFATRFRTEMERQRDIREYGADGAKNLAEADGSRNKSGRGDDGGKQNLNNIMRGSPKWILVRECLSILDIFTEYWNPNDISGARSGRFFRFVLAVYGYAANEEVELKTSKGAKDYTAGLAHPIRLAVKVGPRLRQLNMRGGELSGSEREEQQALWQAWNEGPRR